LTQLPDPKSRDNSLTVAGSLVDSLGEGGLPPEREAGRARAEVEGDELRRISARIISERASRESRDFYKLRYTMLRGRM